MLYRIACSASHKNRRNVTKYCKRRTHTPDEVPKKNNKYEKETEDLYKEQAEKKTFGGIYEFFIVEQSSKTSNVQLSRQLKFCARCLYRMNSKLKYERQTWIH